MVTAARVARREAFNAGHSEAAQERAATRAAQTQAEKVKKKSGFSERQAAKRVGYETVHGKPPTVNPLRSFQAMARRFKTLEANHRALLVQLGELREQVGDMTGDAAMLIAGTLQEVRDRIEAVAAEYGKEAARWLRMANLKNVTPPQRKRLTGAQ